MDDYLFAFGVDGFNADNLAVFGQKLLGGRFGHDLAALGADFLSKALNDARGAALEEVPGHEGLFGRIHRADSAKFSALVHDPVDGLAGFFNQNAKNMRIGTVVVELQSCRQNLVDRGLDAVLLLIAGADAQRAFREVAAAADGRFFFKHDRLDALIDSALSSCQTGKAAAHDQQICLKILGSHGRHCEGCRKACSYSSSQELSSKHSLYSFEWIGPGILLNLQT